jgi:hypothetical protein
MFQRMILHDSAVLYTIAAFSFAVSIFVAVSWRALRMRRSEIKHLADLPFATATPASHDEPKSKSTADR